MASALRHCHGRDDEVPGEPTTLVSHPPGEGAQGLAAKWLARGSRHCPATSSSCHGFSSASGGEDRVLDNLCQALASMIRERWPGYNLGVAG